MNKFLTLLIVIVPISLFSQNLDIRLLESVHTPTALSSDAFFRNVSDSYGLVVFGGSASMAIVALAKNDNELLHNVAVIVAGTLINTAITQGIKYSVQRERPFVSNPSLFMNKTKHEKLGPSFPSGHTSTTFAMATSLSLQYPKWYIIVPGFAWAGSVAYSRMHLGVHYPSDVLAGAVVGAGSAWLTHFLNKKLFKKDNKKPVL